MLLFDFVDLHIDWIRVCVFLKHKQSVQFTRKPETEEAQKENEKDKKGKQEEDEE